VANAPPAVIGLCLAVATSIVAALPVDRFTLAWMHSVERVAWQEDWRIDPDRRSLRLDGSRLLGSGAGMDPPAGAILRDGVWHAPGGLEVDRLRLALSAHTDDWRLCTPSGCQELREIAGAAATGIDLLPCPLRWERPGVS
jgi:hypothetical protein